MDDCYPEWKPDKVKLEPGLFPEYDFKTPYPETRQNASYETSSEQNLALPGRFELHLVYGLPSISEPVASTSQDVASVMVKIKEEMAEESVSSSEHGMVPHFSPATVVQGSGRFTDDRFNIKTEKDNVGESIFITSDPPEPDFLKSDPEKEIYRLSAYELYSDYDSIIDSPCSSFTYANKTVECTEDVVKNRIYSVSNKRPSTSKQCLAFSPFYIRTDLLRTSTLNKRRFSCNQCSAQFGFRSEFKRHLLVHSKEKPFSCVQCSARFTQKSTLKAHSSIHSSEKAFSCDQCPARFRQNSGLYAHRLSSHSDEKPFSCSQCPARFKFKINLVTHLFIHSDKKSFSCDQCSARFKQRQGLYAHLTTHASVKAFSCHKCDARFTRKCSLKRHLLTYFHEKTFVCDQCSAQFKQKRDLYAHSKTHASVKAFCCHECSARFTRKCSLKRHILSSSH